ncbi:hypothetical protein ERO13_D11G022432v2 [Gossypium hirsutum]|uniref:RING-type domain-containing protein n=3 Tax=Gossypium TaxID=3633 RepID=A0A5J5P5D7_GOSBA|nr:hypothetical protein ES319_D11G022900v1 [Gossypium barbadense]KAG4118546.1 hypothetical protein ERO13_D11G022432v2 [Gossypium hirsutum]TYG43525.1 hypothetical protein ES288_D11G024300v1 [Gossypium darwinii]TYI53715.1 hypothetical protein E1A91_D11G023900v1 [Gossypium mustelinum]
MVLPKPYFEILPVILLVLILNLHDSIFTTFFYLGLPYFIESDITEDADHFSNLVDPPNSSAVGFKGFEAEDEIWRLMNCRHIFHRSCLDRWMGYNQKPCPLCRLSFIPLICKIL